MRRLVLGVIALLVASPVAIAGGWATVQLSSTPQGLHAGEVWSVRLTVLQHGRTPLAGVVPRVLIHKPGALSRAFVATPTRKVGVYRARVVFPSPGTWRWQVDDGFGRVHTYFAVRILRASGA